MRTRPIRSQQTARVVLVTEAQAIVETKGFDGGNRLDAPAAEIQDEPLADADGFLEKLSEDIALCASVEDLKEVADSNADMIARLPPDKKVKAAKMLQDAAE